MLVACAGEPRSFAQLRKSLDGLDAAAQTAAIEEYVNAHGGTPFVENNSRLIFLARAVDGRAPRIVGDFNSWAETPQGYDPKIGTTTPIAGGDWSYLEGTAFTNARIEYVLLFDKEAKPDPLNPRTVQEYPGPRSELRMPLWEAQPEIDDKEAVTAGTVIPETLTSRALGAPRRVWYYLPAGYEGGSDLYPTVYVLDGGTYVERMGTAGILDRLIASKKIPAVIAVFSEPGDRQEEYSRNPKWRQFITRELVPTVDKKFRTFPGPEQRAIFGSSLAGYGAVDLAIESPETFGLCGAIAPPEQTATIITNQPQAAQSARSIRFFVLAGAYDPMVNGGRRLRTALEAISVKPVYKEVPEGHNAEMFRGRIDDAISALLQP